MIKAFILPSVVISKELVEYARGLAEKHSSVFEDGLAIEIPILAKLGDKNIIDHIYPIEYESVSGTNTEVEMTEEELIEKNSNDEILSVTLSPNGITIQHYYDGENNEPIYYSTLFFNEVQIN